MLKLNQEKAVTQIEDNLQINTRTLLNIPTGGGKTYILLESARRLLKKHKDKKIVISVPNNNLVRDMYKTSKNEHFKIEDISILVGIDNYIDKKRLLTYYQSSVLEEYIEKDSLDLFIQNIEDKEDIFFDEFEDTIKYKDYSNRNFVRELIKHVDKDFLKEKYESKIIITNHFYILHKVVGDSNFEANKYIYLFDEIHEMPNVAETTLEQSFSLYEIVVTARTIKKDLENLKEEFKGEEAFKKNIHTLMAKAFKLQRKYINIYKTGEYTNDMVEIEPFRKAVNDLFLSSTVENIRKKCMGLSQNFKHKKEFMIKIRYLSALISNAINISKDGITNIGLYYSPSKGYPTLKSSKSSIDGLLHNKFWSRIDYMAGVSATLSYTPQPYGKEEFYAFRRLGLYDKDKELKIFTHNRIFDKNLVKIHQAKENTPTKESVYDNDFQGDSSRYYNYIVDTIYESFENKNSMVLCGGYQEAKFIASLFNKKYPLVNILIANINEKTTTTIEKFKNKGGILFATRNYNTGVSLENKLLEKLYLLNFPYPIFTTYRWFSLKNKKPEIYFQEYTNEMLIALMQTLGRLQRTEKDSGDIYILDNRYKKAKYKKTLSRILKIIDYYGVRAEELDRVKNLLTEKEDKKEKNEEILKQLLL
jgi:Rad3-related DNA helicase